ncbi:MAG: hypothetical protein WC637_08060 [Victivallales bacterium]
MELGDEEDKERMIGLLDGWITGLKLKGITGNVLIHENFGKEFLQI